MRSQRILKIGDRLERKQAVVAPYGADSVWTSGTIIDIYESTILLEYDDGTREFVARNRGLLRIP